MPGPVFMGVQQDSTNDPKNLNGSFLGDTISQVL